MNKQSSILVTGATGFTGSYVARQLLEAGYTNVHGLKRNGSTFELLGEAAEKIQWRQARLEDYFAIEDALEGIEVIIHCAALVSFLSRDKGRLLEVNRGGTRHIVNAALHHGVRRLLYLSSVAALGRNTPGQLITEQSKWEDGPTVSQYSRSKFLAELEVWRGQAEGLSVALVYPTTILGAGRWKKGSVRLFDYAAQAPTFYPTGTTGVVDVRDVARATQLLLERDNDGDRFLLNGSNIPYQHLLAKMTRALGLQAPEKKLSYLSARWLAWLEAIRSQITGRSPLLTRETVQASYRKLVYDNSRSEAELGLLYRSLEETIEQTVAVYEQTREQDYGLLPLSL